MVSADFSLYFKSLPQTQDAARDAWVKTAMENIDGFHFHVFSSIMAALSVGYISFRDQKNLSSRGPYSNDEKDDFYYELVTPFTDKLDPKTSVGAAAIYSGSQFFTFDELKRLVDHKPNQASFEDHAKFSQFLETIQNRWFKETLN